MDPSAIKQTVSEMNGIVQNMYTSAANIEAIFEKLRRTWTGEAKAEFYTLYESDQKAMENFIGEHQKVNDAIQAAALLYQKAHDEVMAELIRLK